jgi:hypothetical protein
LIFQEKGQMSQENEVFLWKSLGDGECSGFYAPAPMAQPETGRKLLAGVGAVRAARI